MKKWLILLSCLLLLLAGCEKAAPPGPLEAAAAPEATTPPEPEAEVETDSQYLAYAALDLPGGLEMAMGQCVAGGRIYVGGQTQEGPALAWTDLEGRSAELELPPEMEHIFALCPTETGFAVLGGTPPAAHMDWRGALISTEDPQGAVWLALYDEDGIQTGVIPLKEAYKDPAMSFSQALAGSDGYYLLCQNLLIHIGGDGAELGRAAVESSESSRRMYLAMALSGDTLYALTGSIDFTAEGMEYWLLSLEPESLEERGRVAVPCQSASGFGLTQDGELLLSCVAEGVSQLAALDPATGRLTSLHDWQSLGGLIPADGIEQWEQGYVFFSRYETEIELLRWVRGVRPEPVVLRMAVTGSNSIAPLVLAFNRSQTDYRVETTAYGSYAEGSRDLDVLRTEIVSGGAPDLLCFCDYGAGGGVVNGGIDLSSVCADLLPYLDGDPDYGREAFIPNLLSGMEQNGRLYSLPLAYSIVTVLAPAELLPEAGITAADLETALAQAGPEWVTFEGWMTPENLLGWTDAFVIGAYVDRDAGTCRFDTQAFQDYLTWCRTWGRSDVPQEGEVFLGDPDEQPLLQCLSINSAREVVTAATRRAHQGYERAYVGMPVGEGNGSMYELAVEVGVSNQTAHADGAWQFLRFCLDHQADGVFYGLPVLQAVLDDQIAWYQSGEAVGWMGEPEVADQADVDRFCRLLDGTTVVGGEDEALLAILADEAAYYFAGQRTAAEAAAVIQNRASLYLAEQYG